MLRALPHPVLTVTHDVLKDIDGDDALSNLWLLFTKCKSGLQDGRRLENISWRLWHRELVDPQTYRPLTPESPADEGTAPPFSHTNNTGHTHAGPSSSTRARIGKVIDDISRETISLGPRSPMPTPTSRVTTTISITTAANDPPQQPMTPRRTLAADPDFPRVVVVNPTPHPTPPATPILPPTTTGLPFPNSQSQLPPPKNHMPPPRQGPRVNPSSLRPDMTPKFFTGSPSSSSTSGSSGSSSSSSQDSPDETSEHSSNTTSADLPPSFSRSETNISDKLLTSTSNTNTLRIAAPAKRPTIPRHSRVPSTADRDRLEAEDRQLAEEHRSQQERELRHRREMEEKERLIAREREREWQRQRQKESEEEERRKAALDRELTMAREREMAKQREFLRVQAEKDGQIRRTASVGQLPAQDAVIFDFTEESTHEPQFGLQASGSHPELTRTVFGLNRALSPPKASTSAAPVTRPSNKARDAAFVKSSTNLQTLAKEKAAMRMQNTLRGAFTPMAKGSPTRSDSSKASSTKGAKASASVPQAKAASPAQTSNRSPPKSTTSSKGKEKAVNPHGAPRQIVLVDSDEETISDEEEEWTSADEDEEEEQVQAPPPTRPKARSASPARQSSRARAQAPPPAAPPPNNNRTRNRRQMPPDMQKHLQMDDVREAFEEAERQKELFTFAKLPKRSYSNLSRTNSGFLSQLMNPDSQSAPDEHSYRRGHSSSDLRTRIRSAGPMLHPSQSAMALPVAANVHVGSVRESGVMRTVDREHDQKQKRDYRPKARPEEQEMDDDDETDGEDNSLTVSNSVAQEKLKAIFGNLRGGGGNANAPIVNPIRPERLVEQSPPADRRERRGASMPQANNAPPTAPPLGRTMTEPVALPPSFPYNLPIAALPVSPRTTRQWMLRTEMSESVRANLIWQRKMDKQLMSAPRRNKSSNAISSIPSVVKITEKKNAGDVETTSALLEDEREQSRNEFRRVNLMRNKSWAADYHPS